MRADSLQMIKYIPVRPLWVVSSPRRRAYLPTKMLNPTNTRVYTQELMVLGPAKTCGYPRYVIQEVERFAVNIWWLARCCVVVTKGLKVCRAAVHRNGGTFIPAQVVLHTLNPSQVQASEYIPGHLT